MYRTTPVLFGWLQVQALDVGCVLRWLPMQSIGTSLISMELPPNRRLLVVVRVSQQA